MSLNKKSFVYNGKVQKPGYTVTANGNAAAANVAYPSGCKDAGTYTVKANLTGNYSGSATATFTIAKAKNPITAKAKSPALKASAVKKKNQTITAKKAITVSKNQGKVTYKKLSGNKKITVSKAGKFTVKKGLKKGTYKVKVNVSAAGNKNYKAGSKTVTVKVRIK